MKKENRELRKSAWAALFVVAGVLIIAYAVQLIEAVLAKEFLESIINVMYVSMEAAAMFVAMRTLAKMIIEDLMGKTAKGGIYFNNFIFKNEENSAEEH